MSRHLTAFAVGILFAIGLGLSGMTLPQKIIGFLDVLGEWDPSLMFVMGGALAVNIVAFRLTVRRDKPLFAAAFQVPTRRDLDARLISGAALFGIGWGLSGFCPGPAITAISSLSMGPVLFVGSMAAGMVILRLLDRPKV